MSVFDRFKRLREGRETETDEAVLYASKTAQPVLPIGKKQIERATLTLQKYKAGKANLERRIVENEQWWKLRHWEQIRNENNTDPEPVSAWTLNCILNKHADAMDNIPEASVLPREESDKNAAEQLSAILPTVFEQAEYEQTYSDVWLYKIKAGAGVQGVFWNPRKANGLGDIDIKYVDILNLFWEPGINDIQSSRNVFHVALIDNDILQQQYPQLENKLGTSVINLTQYVYDDTVDTSDKSAVVDWYYKKYNGSREILHYCKFVNNELLYASENDPNYAEKGFYHHGKYPYDFDPMFKEEGTPAGFGYIDIMKDPQMYIDKLNQIILKNAFLAGQPRYFIRSDGAVNEAEFADFNKSFVHLNGKLSEDDLREIQTKPLPASISNILTQKIEELKETSGNRDFSQGGTTSGVTAASAIAALQEAGSKLSRDMIKSSYRAFTRVTYLVIELIRQFYDEPRCFRILGENGAEKYVQYSNQGMKPQPQGNDFGLDLGYRLPIFDIKVRAHKANSFSRISQNELAKEFFGMGFFNPEMADQALACIEMMDFEGKESVVRRISQNGTLLQMVQQLQAQMLQMAQIIDAQNGTQMAQGIAANMMGGQPIPAGSDAGGNTETNALGAAVQSAGNTTADTARARAMNVSAPR